jgi:predicted nucleic acid-binding Zn ribbon protein
VTAYRRSPRRLAVAIGQVRDGLEPDSLLAEVQRVWRDAVGPMIAVEAEPTGERGGVVTVSCSASVWAQELDLMGPVIVENLNRALRIGRVSRLRCVTLPSRV